MAAGSDDLLDLLSGAGAPGSAAPQVYYRQGVVAAWDAATGANTVTIGVVGYTNLPYLKSMTTPAVGAVVAVLVVRGDQGLSTYLVAGEIVDPSTP